MFSDSVMYTNIMDNYTVTGHVVGMLDRDQRTAKLRCDSYRQSAMFLVFHTHSHYCYVHPRENKLPKEKISHRHLLKTKSSHSTRSRKNSYLWNTLRRLKQALITGIYLLSLVSVPCSLSAPAHMADRYKSHPKWINPCGMNIDDGAVHDMNIPTPREVADVELLEHIVSQARIALTAADKFKEIFVQAAFKKDFKQHLEEWNGDFDWLPRSKEDFHKNLTEPVAEDHLMSLKLDDTLLNAYHYLQMIAVGLEQMVWDQQDDGPFLQGFNTSEFNLRLVLCEIQMAIYERGIHSQMKPDVTRDIMSEDYRNYDDKNITERNVRDWIIYKDYMNALEYVVQVFHYLKSKI